ncbi:MAG: MotA/TolQ/ExbB proton channel family protein [Pseudomonadota bacterium]
MSDLKAQLDNGVVWLILVTAIVAYTLLFDLWLSRRSKTQWRMRLRQLGPGIRTLLSALPLLGLFGTVVGLMQTFQQMSVDHGFNPETLATGGIAAAMYTTQLGLLLTIPGWVGLALLQSSARRFLLTHSNPTAKVTNKQRDAS